MQHIKILLLVLLFSCCTVKEIFAKKKYAIDSVRIDAVVFPNGSMIVKETRRYQFDGSFSYAYREFPKQEGIIFTDFKVMEGGKELRLSEEEEEGHYLVLDKKKFTEVGWAFKAKDEAREFTIVFTVLDVVQRYEDVAVIYYKFIDKQWKVNQSNIQIRVSYAGSQDLPGEVRHWLHGPAGAYTEVIADNVIVIQCDLLGKKDFLELRAIYPATWFPDTRVIQGTVREDVVAEEKEWAEEANILRQKAKEREAFFEQVYSLGPGIILGFYLLILGIAYEIYTRHHQSFPRQPQAKPFVVKPPSRLHPALINYLLYGYNMGTEIGATLYKLATEHLLQIEDRNDGDKSSKKQLFWTINRQTYEETKHLLLPFERLLVEYFFDTTAKGADEIAFDDMNKNTVARHQMVGKFNKQVYQHGKALGIWNATSITGRNYMILLTVIVAFVLIPAIILFKVWSVLILILVMILIVLCLMIPQRDPSFQTEYHAWMAYKKYLKQSLKENSKGSISHTMVNDHLVYGTVFGLSKNEVTRLIKAVPEDCYHDYLYWYLVSNPSRMAPATMSKTISEVAGNLASSPMSSASGAGGGASFGGGGGFSGGGGGAR